MHTTKKCIYFQKHEVIMVDATTIRLLSKTKRDLDKIVIFGETHDDIVKRLIRHFKRGKTDTNISVTKKHPKEKKSQKNPKVNNKQKSQKKQKILHQQLLDSKFLMKPPNSFSHKCPFCNTPFMDKPTKCKHCKKDLPW